jgi:hypothetical protein
MEYAWLARCASNTPGRFTTFMHRGDRPESIFKDDQNRERFLETLWNDQDLKARRNGDPGKLKLAKESRSHNSSFRGLLSHFITVLPAHASQFIQNHQV